MQNEHLTTQEKYTETIGTFGWMAASISERLGRAQNRVTTHLHVEKERGHNLLHVLCRPDVLHQIVGHCFPDNALQALDSRQAQTVSHAGRIAVAHRRELRNEEVVASMVGRSVLVDVGELHKLQV